MVVNSSVREALLHVAKNLPAAPAILAQLSRVLLGGDADLGDAVHLLKCDPALTARIVRLANSVMYGFAAPVGSVEEALARVGFNEVYRLTGLAAVATLCGEHIGLYGITAAELRENSVLVALMMERVAPAAGVEPASAYTAGLLRGIGRIALDRIAPPARLRAHVYSPHEDGPVADWERQFVGLSNCDAAALVLEHWRFPGPTVEAVREQYLPAADDGRLAHLLHLVAAQAERCSHGLPGEASYWSQSEQKLARAGVDAVALNEAMRDALEEFGPIREALA